MVVFVCPKKRTNKYRRMSRETIFFFFRENSRRYPLLSPLESLRRTPKEWCVFLNSLQYGRLSCQHISSQTSHTLTLCWIRNYFQVILSIRDWFPILHEIGISWNGLNQTVLDQLGHDQIQGNTFSSSDARRGSVHFWRKYVSVV